MLKRTYPAILCALLLCLWTTVHAADPALTLTVPGGDLSAGARFTVTVSVQDNPGFNTLQFTLTYDSAQVTCESAKGGEVIENMIYATNPDAGDCAIVVAISNQDVTEDGALALFQFTANEAVSDPSFELTELLMQDARGRELPLTVTLEQVQPTPSDEAAFEGVREDGSDVGTGDLDISPQALEELLSGETGPSAAPAGSPAPSAAGSASAAPTATDAPSASAAPAEGGSSDGTTAAPESQTAPEGSTVPEGSAVPEVPADSPEVDPESADAAPAAEPEEAVTDAAEGSFSAPDALDQLDNGAGQTSSAVTVSDTEPTRSASGLGPVWWVLLAAVLLLAGALTARAIRRK